MRIIKIESCYNCTDKHLIGELVRAKCPLTNTKVKTLRRYMQKTSNEVHPDCPLDKHVDTETIKELCEQPWDSYAELQIEILAIINQ